MKNIFKLLLTVSLVACAASKTKLSDDGKKVKVLANKKTDGCHVVDKVVGMNEKGSPELARNHVKNLAAKMDGNAIYIDDEVNNGDDVKIHATVYQCED